MLTDPDPPVINKGFGVRIVTAEKSSNVGSRGNTLFSPM